MKKSPISLLTASFLLAFSSCGNNPSKPVKNAYTVSFNSHGGSPVADLVDVSVVEESPVTNRSGYDFEGWYVDTTYTSDKKVSFPYKVTEDITLHANWTALTYTVTFNTHGGTAVSTLTNVTVIETSPVTSRDGYDFLGWYLDTSYTDDKKVSFPYTVSENLTLHAGWSASKFVVSFDTDGGSEVSPMETKLIQECPVTTKYGYDFVGWFTSLSEEEAVSFPYQVTTSQTLYAKWTRDTSIYLFDGITDEDIWTTDVKENSISIAANDSNYTNLIATKQEDGLYLFADQYVSEKKNAGPDWYLHDNIEFRFGNQNSKLFVDERQDGVAFIDQIWFSSLKTGSINSKDFYVSDYVESNGGYNLKYEIYLSWETLNNCKYNLCYEDSIIFVSGISYAAGWATTPVWSGNEANLEKYQEIKTSGITSFSYDSVSVDYEELNVNKETFVADGYFQLGCQTLYVDGSKSWSLAVDFDCTNSNPMAFGDGFAMEVCSPSWSSGGWSFRKDWWAWGGWNNNSGEGNAGPHDKTSVGDDQNVWSPALSNINVKGRLSFNAISGFITFAAVYTSKHSDYEGKKIYISYYSKMFDYRGAMEVKFGASFGTIKLNLVGLAEGSILS